MGLKVKFSWVYFLITEYLPSKTSKDYLHRYRVFCFAKSHDLYLLILSAEKVSKALVKCYFFSDTFLSWKVSKASALLPSPHFEILFLIIKRDGLEHLK